MTSIPQTLLDQIFSAGSAPAVKRGEEIFAGTDYPRTWDEFVGQHQVKEQLQVRVASAIARGVRLDHTLLASGIPGVGKTTLATLLAYTAGVGFLQTTGPLSLETATDLLTGMQDHDILFIDEAHLLVTGNRNRADWLLPFMTEGVLYTAGGPVDVPDVSIVAATTDVGKLPQTLISRFMVRPTITPYRPEEGAEIAHRLAGRMGVEGIDLNSLIAITEAADHNPRVMRQILTAVRDLRFANPDGHPNLERAFEWVGVSTDGLTTVARDILLLLTASRDQTASIDSIRAHLNEPGPIRHHEQQLLQRGLVTITGRGRMLTDAGIERARLEVERLRAKR